MSLPRFERGKTAVISGSLGGEKSALVDAIPDDEVDEERRVTRATAFFEAELHDLPLTRLRDRTFEILALALARAEATRDPSRFDAASLLREGADKGRDVLLLKNERIVGVIQCKRYSSAIALPSILRELMRFALLAGHETALVPRPNGFIYELWTAGEISGEAQQFFNSPHAWIDANRNQLIHAAQKARVGVAALKVGDSLTAAAENEAAVQLVRRFKLTTIGPVDIRLHLADEHAIRRSFFRGPDDRPHPARAADVERLMSVIRDDVARDWATKAELFVSRPSLDREFEAFMASPAKVFVIVGGSGDGKSTWASRVLNLPPKAVTVDIIRGEDIHPSDQHVADTIARALQRRPLGDVTSIDLVQAVFDWLVNASRLIIIDGIDRAPKLARPSLHDYLKRTFDTTTHSSTRFVVTSRQQAWADVGPDINFNRAEVHMPVGSSPTDFPALGLAALSREEAREVYYAYGLIPPKESARFFRSPGLIAREAVVRSSGDTRLGTRLAVLLGSVRDLERRLRRDHEVGPQQFAFLLQLLGDRLVQSGDGLLDAGPLREQLSGSLAVLDRLIEAGLVVLDGRFIRIEPDDMVEYLMSLRLDVRGARALLEKDGGDLLVGAAALCVARLEEEGADQVREAIDVLRAGASFDHPALAAAARAVTELRSKVLVRSILDDMLRAWTDMNLLLSASPLVRLLDEVDLRPLERLEAAMVLAAGEDTWDWRGKYFQDPTRVADRFVTGFGRAAASAIADDPEAALVFLLELAKKAEASEEGFNTYESVLSGLISLAIDGAPEAAAQIAWRTRGTGKDWLLDRVINNQPEAVASLLGSLAGHKRDDNAAIDCLWCMTREPPPERADDVHFRKAVGDAAAAHLQHTVSVPQVVKLLVAKLLGEPDHDGEAQLSALWDHVDDEVFWIAVQARSSSRLELLTDRIIRGAAEGREWLLQTLPVQLFPSEDWAGVAQVLGNAADDGLGRAAALALETMLNWAAGSDEIGRLMPLARKFASSKESGSRSPMIYFAGGSSLRGDPPAVGERAELLDLLALHEDGATLDPLVWKLVASARSNSSGLQNLSLLCERFGGPAVDAIVSKYRLTQPESIGALRTAWRMLPAGKRPPLKALRGR
jgi:hypothetical protein